MVRRADLLEVAVLGLLHEGPTHGYELRRRLNEALGPFRALGYGTLYPALASLTDRGLLASTSTSGTRGRIEYRLTAAGKERFDDLVGHADSHASDDDEFDVRFHFFARTAHEVRLRILEGRRSRLEEDLDRMREARAARRERADAWSRSLQQLGEEQREREVRWLSELIDAERRHPDDPGPQP